MANQRIQLTEQDLHMLVDDAVRTYLINEGMDEGIGGYLGGMFSRAGKQARTAGENLGTSLNNKLTQAKDYMGKQYQKAKTGVQNYQRAGQVSSINQDAQKAITTAYNALNNLRTLSSKLQGITGYPAFGEKLGAAVENCMTALQSEGNLNNDARGAFASQKKTATDPNASFYERK